MAINIFMYSDLKVRTLHNGNAYFNATDIATCLGYVLARKAVRDHVFAEDRFTLGDLQNNTHECKHSVYINEAGMYALIFGSKTQGAIQFKKWVCQHLLPKVLRVGKEQAQAPLSLHSEASLHHKVVAFIRRFYPDALLAPGLGELQDLPEKRIIGWRCGYKSGQPDLLILNQHKTFNGFALEFKHPNGSGKLSTNQISTLSKYRICNYRTLVSNDYDLILKELFDYFANTRLCCPHCRLKFKTSISLSTHCRVIHDRTTNLALNDE